MAKIESKTPHSRTQECCADLGARRSYLEFLSSFSLTFLCGLGNGCVRMRLEKAGQSLVQRGPVDPLRENMVDDV